MVSASVAPPLNLARAVNYVAAQLRISRKMQKTPKAATSVAVVDNDKMMKKAIDDLNKMLASSQQDIAEMMSKIDSYEDSADMMQDNFEVTFARLDYYDSLRISSTNAVIDSPMEQVKAMTEMTVKDIEKMMTERIDETRTSTLTFMYDAVNDCDAKIETLKTNVDEELVDLRSAIEVIGGDLAEIEERVDEHDEPIRHVQNAMRAAYDATSGNGKG